MWDVKYVVGYKEYYWHVGFISTMWDVKVKCRSCGKETRNVLSRLCGM